MTVAVHEPVAYELADYRRLLRRRGWIVLLLAVLGLVAGAGFLHTQSKVFTSTVSVLVRGNGDNGAVAGGRTSTPVNLDTEAQLVQSEALAAQVAKALGVSDAPTDLVSRVAVTVPPNTSVLTISYDGATAEQAQRGAQAYATAYLAARLKLTQDDAASSLKALQTQVTGLETTLRDVTGRIASLPANSPDRTLALAQQNVLVNQITALQGQISPLVQHDLNIGRIISDASKSDQPSSPVPLLYLVGGLVVGALLGVALAALLDRADKRVRRGAEIERLLGLPLLAGVPRVRQVDLLDGETRAGEAFRSLRNALEAQLGASGVVLVAGASPGSGGSFVAANLGAALARAGRRTVVVCADGRLGGTAALLGVEAEAPDGAGRAVNASGAVLQAHATLLGLAAWLPPESRSTTGVKDVETVIDGFRSQYDFVVVVASSTEQSADAQELARAAEGQVLVVELGRTRQQQILDALEQFSRVRSPVLGAVTVTVPGLRRSRRLAASPTVDSTPASLAPQAEVSWSPAEQPTAKT